MRILYVSDIGPKSAVYKSQVEEYVEELRCHASVDLIGFSHEYKSRSASCVYLPPKMFVLSAWIAYVKVSLSIDFDKYDAAIFRGYLGGMAALALLPELRRTQCRFALDVRADVEDEFSRARGLNASVNRLFLPAIRRNLRRQFVASDAIFAVSSRLRQTISSRYDVSPLKVLSQSTSVSRRFAVDTVAEREYRELFGFREEEVVFVYSGGLDYWQNFEEILKSFDEYAADGGVGRLLVLTKNVDEAVRRVDQLCSRSGNRVVVTSSPASEIHRYLQAADVGLLIRDDIPLNRAASPTKYGEYFNSGLHIVLTNLDSDYVRHARAYPECCTIIQSKTDLKTAMLGFETRPKRHVLRVQDLSEIVQAQLEFLF